MSNDYRPGDYYGICDECGFKVRASELKRRWDNLQVCSKDWEPRHPQDFIRGKKDRQRVANPSPEAPDTFIAINAVTPESL